MFSLYLSVIEVRDGSWMVMSHSQACERQTMFTHDIPIQGLQQTRVSDEVAQQLFVPSFTRMAH